MNITVYLPLKINLGKVMPSKDDKKIHYSLEVFVECFIDQRIVNRKEFTAVVFSSTKNGNFT